MKSAEWDKVDPELRTKIESVYASFPVKVAELAKLLRLKVNSATLPPGISGEIRPTAGGFMIRVNRHDSVVRQRFTVAHEIAHFLLHKNHIGGGISDDALYRSSLSDVREAEANRLAADILMPFEVVRRELKARDGLGDQQKIVELAQFFGVSEVAMSIRLGFK
ncbi:ImmA/IrrE family metallo-endopeptidase [Xanthomonas arboricola]|uniref:ImmA/IrrE family metallo-endopeptidase n=1 Tax=Xanthomonas arboricola TaxID=56448 RepID=UPI000F8C7E42|nr:ImmA/IrrE family metallo-endopeptidase [Xanthomonas arboricola]